jgi:hypothetical protein
VRHRIGPHNMNMLKHILLQHSPQHEMPQPPQFGFIVVSTQAPPQHS